MRKIFTALVVGLLLVNFANANVRRSQPTYSFSRSQSTKNNRFTRPQWRTAFSVYKYRFSNTYKSSDLLWWQTIEPQTYDAGTTEQPIPKDFCNYESTIIGEYLPSAEVRNRCCVCSDGWKCEYPDISGSTEQRPCTPDWQPPYTTEEENEV